MDVAAIIPEVRNKQLPQADYPSCVFGINSEASGMFECLLFCTFPVYLVPLFPLVALFRSIYGLSAML